MLISAGTANAGLVPSQWFLGDWKCCVDGRPARMEWYAANDQQTTCDGDVCSTVNGVTVVGRMSDNVFTWT
jgi:hypothetical protein